MHVLVKLFCLLMLALGLTYFNLLQLGWLTIVLTTVAIKLDPRGFIRMMQRVRWLLIVLLVIYGFSTPGEYLSFWKIMPRPTYEGLLEGGSQLMRMWIMLSGLCAVLATTRRSALIGGIYQLMLPFKCLHLNAEKFAVRIWLTLIYVEMRQSSDSAFLKSLDFNALFMQSQTVGLQGKQETIAIELRPLKWKDYCLMLAITLYVILLKVV